MMLPSLCSSISEPVLYMYTLEKPLYHYIGQSYKQKINVALCTSMARKTKGRFGYWL